MRWLLMSLLGACSSSLQVEATDTAARERPPPIPEVLQLDTTEAILGDFMDFHATGAQPGEWVHFAVGGPGSTCLPGLGGYCLGVRPMTYLGRARASSAGDATFTFRLPQMVALTQVCAQAAVQRGVSGASSIGSNVECFPLIDPNACTPVPWYPDVDGDGYGVTAAATSPLCDSPGSLYVALGEDCDDGDDTAHPGGTEIAGDGIDQDCDGTDAVPSDTDGGQDDAAILAAIAAANQQTWHDTGGPVVHHLPFADGVHMGISQGTDCLGHSGSLEGSVDFTVAGNVEVANNLTANASAPGTVVGLQTNVTGYLSNSYGNYVLLRHGGGTYTLYAHLRPVDGVQVTNGQEVCAGDVLGYIGTTGTSTGEHLHYEQRDPAGARVQPSFVELPTVPAGCYPCTTRTHTAGCYGSENQAGQCHTCIDTCPTPNISQCTSPTSEETCADHDGDGCVEWGAGRSCAYGCVGNGCATCTNTCSVGSSRCSNGMQETCSDTNGDGCVEWGSGQTCQFGCNGTTCATTAPSCSLPWGGTIASGASVTAYQSAGGCGASCTPQTRTCTNGTLSGSYTYASCTPACQSCSLPWGGTIQSGSSVTAYQSSSVACGSSCTSQTRTCTNGTLSGSYSSSSCSATQCAPTAATIASTPTSAMVGQPVSISVTRGTDSNGDTVKVQCTAEDSNYWPDPNAYVSSFSTGGTPVTVSFQFSVAGTKTIWCTSFDSTGLSSSVASRTISVAPNWNCANSLYNGVQYWTCSGNSMFRCSNNVPQETVCGTLGCFANATGRDDICVTSDAGWNCAASLYNGTQYWTCSSGVLHKCNSANQGVRVNCPSGCNVLANGTNDTCR